MIPRDEWPGAGRRIVKIGLDQFSVRNDITVSDVRAAMRWRGMGDRCYDYYLARPISCDQLVDDWRAAMEARP
jgi:hypothetical protein